MAPAVAVPRTDPTPEVPLWRNRSFNLLWIGQSMSDLGGSMSGLAVPLLVLALTGSPWQAGLVGTVVLMAGVACRLPAGVLADRLDRRRTILVSDSVRLVTYLGLGLAVLADAAGLPLIIGALLVGIVAGTIVDMAQHAALASLVPAGQLPAAVARNEARSYGTELAGPPLGGVLFGLDRALPFLGNAVSFLLSLICVLLIRRPMQQPRATTRQGHGADLMEGVRFVLRTPFLRAVLLIAVPLNFGVGGVIFALIVVLQRNGTPPALIGTASAIIGVGGLLGAVAAPALQRRVRLSVLTIAICWALAGLTGVSALLAGGVVPAPPLAAAVPVALAILLSPACNAALFGHQAAITPDRLQGRVLSVIFFGATSLGAVAPAVAGLLLDRFGGMVAMLAFAAVMGGAAVIATTSQGIREARPVVSARS
ncbi:MFS transporter [Plantactinospora sp. GCM10030261]|uniref:MFS transporter n=1 Tax=Plantactinospora sp. GCM10030261 TaxID=3273420 RepID=UPI00361C3290